MNIILIYFSIKYKGDWDKIYRALEDKEKVSLADIQKLENEMKESKWNLGTILDQDYPKRLKEAYKPPFVYWYKGDKKLLKKKFICASGNQTDEVTIERVKKFSKELTKSYNLVTASYKGIDENILQETVGSKRLFILADGIDKAYAKEKPTDNDLVFSEYPPGSHVTKDTLRNRNRLIAAFAESLVLFSSEKDGPINHLVTNFLNLGKEIYAFPGDGGDKDGNSALIKQGANLITEIKDIGK
ncbi:MAG: DNA-protecting protein DprA [Mycoplasmataceae bacterium]|nr:DNA-protecting protein DprA [Mycoplasmataceae bacterium]